MSIYVKLTNETIENLQKMLGVSAGSLNLNRGLFRVEDQEAVDTLAKRQMIENVNNHTYEEFLQNIAKQEKAGKAPAVTSDKKDTTKTDKAKPAAEMTANERNKIIGGEPTVGSIVRTGKGDEVEHLVILAVNDDSFTTATMHLKQKKLTQGAVILEKGVDVLYRNPTYKDKVTVTKEITYGLTADKFKRGSGGLIVGKVIGMDKLKPLIDYATNMGESEDGEEGKTVEK